MTQAHDGDSGPQLATRRLAVRAGLAAAIAFVAGVAPTVSNAAPVARQSSRKAIPKGSAKTKVGSRKTLNQKIPAKLPGNTKVR